MRYYDYFCVGDTVRIHIPDEELIKLRRLSPEHKEFVQFLRLHDTIGTIFIVSDVGGNIYGKQSVKFRGVQMPAIHRGWIPCCFVELVFDEMYG